MNINQKLIKITKKNAIQNIYNGGGPFACIITDRDGFTIGKGENQVTKNNDPTAHAEIVAIRDACQNVKDFKLSDCILYTSSEPCPMCLSAIYWAGIKDIYYGYTRKEASSVGFIDDFIYDELKNNTTERSINMYHIHDTHDDDNVFDEWKNYDKKIRY